MSFSKFVQDGLPLIGLRCDANETAAVENAMRVVQTQLYEKKYPELTARRLVPVNTSWPEWAATIGYRSFESFGEAEIMEEASDNAPMVNSKGSEQFQAMFTLRMAYQYNKFELKRAAQTLEPLDQARANAARKAIEHKLDKLIWVGDVDKGIKGLANATGLLDASDVDTVHDWESEGTTADDINADLMNMFKAIVTETNGMFQGNFTLALPTPWWVRLATEERSDFNADKLLNYFLAKNPWLSAIEHCPRLNTAGDGGVPRALLYPRDNDVAEFVLAADFTQEAPQARNMAFVVDTYARFSSVLVRQPKAICFADKP